MPTTTDTTILDQLAAHAGSLYSLPAVALEILQLTGSPKVDVRALKERIECDPALTTKILRTVNSAIFGLSGQVSDLNQALALLGIKSLKMLVLGFSLPSAIFKGVDKEVLTHYWRHTLTRAVACRELCRTMRSKLGDETFIAALLQDLGILVLVQELGEPYAQLFRRACNDQYDLATLEYRATGFDHTQLTGRLLRNWSLPETLINTIDTSPHLQMPLSPELLQQRAILAVAEKIALILADQRSGMLTETLRQATEALRINHDQFFEAMGRVEEMVLQLGDILSLQLPAGLGYEDLLNQARQSMAEVSLSMKGRGEGREERGEGGEVSPEEYAVLEAELQNVSKALAIAVAEKVRLATTSSPEKKQVAPSQTPQPRATRIDASVSQSAVPHRQPNRQQKKTEMSTAHHDLLLDRVSKAIDVCRQKRIPLSLLVSDVVLQGGNTSSGYAASSIASTKRWFLLEKLLGNARHDLEQVCMTLDHPFHLSCPFGENGVAVVLLDCERSNALELADELIRSMPKEYNSLSNHKIEAEEPSIRLGLGIASASAISPNFFPEGLIEGANRCLHASLAAIAGRAVKSIEVF